MERKNIRIKDIAEMAGVSEGTVDRVLHKRGKVSKSASEKVNRILAEINYTPNLIARTLGANRTYQLAIVIPNPALDPYWNQSFEGIKQAEEELAQFGIALTIEYLFYDLHKKESFQDVTLKTFYSKPDGILIAPLFYYASMPFFKVLKESKIPFVLFNTFIKEAEGLTFIGQDLFQSGKLAAELLSFGNTSESNFAILHIEEDLANSIHLIEKERGFKSYFESEATELNPIKSFSVCAPDQPEFEKQMDAIVTIPHLKGLYVSTSKTYVIAQELEKRKLKIRLIGYDLLEENLEYLRKGYIDFLIHQNPRRQAKLGVRSLANYLLFAKIPPKLNLFPLEIISRNNIDSYLN
jgi:LacI family transcriptional regulator